MKAGTKIDSVPKAADFPEKFDGRKNNPQPKGGSRKGIPNKVTKALKDMILGALDDNGGQAYLAQQARDNPGPFLALIGKVLPVTLAGDASNPLVVQIVRFADADQAQE